MVVADSYEERFLGFHASFLSEVGTFFFDRIVRTFELYYGGVQ